MMAKAKDDDKLFTYAEAAPYCGVSRQAVYQCLKAAGVEPIYGEQNPGVPGSRHVAKVRKGTIDGMRQHGYLSPAPRKPAATI